MIRVDMIFNYESNPAATTNPLTRPKRVGGWTESFYEDAAFSTGYTYPTLKQKRVPLLGNGSSLIAIRTNEILINQNKATIGQVSLLPINTNNKGPTANTQDIANACLDVAMRSAGNTKNIRKFRLGGIPDDWITGGEWNPSAGGQPALDAYLAYLQSNVGGPPAAFLGRSLDPTIAPRLPILQGIANPTNQTMTLTLAAAPGGGLSAMDFVSFFRTKDVNGKKVQGQFQVQSITGAQVVLYPYLGTANIGNSGKVSRIRLQLFPLGAPIRYFAGTHKIGRPFDVFHGRVRRR